jgi:cyclopropane fatty-acyl-phospholipid synthase-like methyltransferase
VLKAFPRARVYGLDLSPLMVEEGTRRLARFGQRARMSEWDLEVAEWPATAPGPYAAVVSSLAIHHLNRERKAQLAVQVMEHLQPGGVLLNLDYVSPPSETLAQRYQQAEARFVDPRHDQAGHGHNLAGGHSTDSLDVQLDDLRAAGFVDVDVFWKRLSLALFGGTKT